MDHKKPTESELEILQILWKQGTATVRDVHAQLILNKDIRYTTTLKLMQIMTEKDLVTRDTSKRTHVYQANVGEEATQQKLLKQFTDLTFRGSAMRLVMQALGNHDASQEELDAIKALIEKKEKE